MYILKTLRGTQIIQVADPNPESGVSETWVHPRNGEAEHDVRTWIPGVFPSCSDKTTTVSFQLTGTAKKGPELCQKLDLLWCRQLSLPPMLPTELSVGLLGRIILGSQIWKGLAVLLWVDENISELAGKMVRNPLPLWLKAFPRNQSIEIPSFAAKWVPPHNYKLVHTPMT